MRRFKKSVGLLITMTLIAILTATVPGISSDLASGKNGNNETMTNFYSLLSDTKPEDRYIRDQHGNRSPLTAEVLSNNVKLFEVSKRFNSLWDKYEAEGIFGGAFADVFTCTFNVWLKEIKEEYTKPIESIIREIEGVEVKFIKARFSLIELYMFQSMIEEAFLNGLTSYEVRLLDSIKDRILREERAKEITMKAKKRDNSRVVVLPITFIGLDFWNNGLVIMLEELKPQYMKAIRQIVGDEVAIQFKEGDGKLSSGRPPTDRYIPDLIGGIQIFTPPRATTIGFRAFCWNTGALGFVMTGHVGWVNTQVHQPTIASNNLVGTITKNPSRTTTGDLGLGRRSDAAFVTVNTGINVHRRIWPNDRYIHAWESSSPDRHIGRVLFKSGITQPWVTHGSTVFVGRITSPIFGALYNQVFTTIPVADGDSGGPIWQDLGGPVLIYGVVVGTIGGPTAQSYYSPIIGITEDLGVFGP